MLMRITSITTRSVAKGESVSHKHLADRTNRDSLCSRFIDGAEYKWGRTYRAILRGMWRDSTFKSVISISHRRFRQAKRSLDRAHVTMCPVHCLPTFV